MGRNDMHSIMIAINVHRLRWCLRRMPGITKIKYLWLQKHIGVFLSHVDDNFAAPVEMGGLLVCIYKQITPGERSSLSIEIGDEIRRYKRINAKSPFYLAKVKDVLARKLNRRPVPDKWRRLVLARSPLR